MFNFRLINTPDGNQIIDTTLKTPYSSITPLQMEEYIEIDNQLAYMERMERKKEREAERIYNRRMLCKCAENSRLWKLIHKVACMCGIM